MKGFTPEELAEMAAFDAEIEAEPLTMEEIRESRARDREAALDGMDKRKRAIAERSKAYYEANREALREKNRLRMRAYRQKKKEAAACQAGLTESCVTSTGE